jgi:hypothetical protein
MDDDFQRFDVAHRKNRPAGLNVLVRFGAALDDQPVEGGPQDRVFQGFRALAFLRRSDVAFFPGFVVAGGRDDAPRVQGTGPFQGSRRMFQAGRALSRARRKSRWSSCARISPRRTFAPSGACMPSIRPDTENPSSTRRAPRTLPGNERKGVASEARTVAGGTGRSGSLGAGCSATGESGKSSEIPAIDAARTADAPPIVGARRFNHSENAGVCGCFP